jgi:hypothetical protein
MGLQHRLGILSYWRVGLLLVIIIILLLLGYI